MVVTSIGFNLLRASPFISRGVSNAMYRTPQIQNICQTRGLRYFQEKLIKLMYWRGRSFDKVDLEFKRSDQQDWNYKTEIYAFSRRLQENLSEDTLRRVFTNPSYISSLEKDGGQYDMPMIQLDSNEELVNRGITLMDDIIKPYMRHHFDKMPEEGIAAITDYLKSEEVLANIAKWIGCKDIILTAEYPPSSAAMASTVPAIIAGIEKDLGFERARRFIVDMIITYIHDLPIMEKIWQIPHPRETLNMILEGSGLPSYEPRIIFQTGIKTLEACHVIGLYSNKNFLGSSAGETLDIAEECASLDAMMRLFDLKNNRRPLTFGDKSELIDYSLHTKPHPELTNWKFELATS